MSEVMDEINEELRRQKLEQFWIENRNWIIGGVLLAVLTTAGMTWWRGYAYQQNIRRTDQLMAAIDSNDVAKLTGYAEQSGKNHAALAKFTAAGIEAKAGNIAAAAKLYSDIAGTLSVDRNLRDLAKIMSLNLRLGSEEPKKLHKELGDISGEKDPFRFSALEMDALVYAKEGNMKEAAAKLEAISASPNAPEDARLRATTLREFYAASANESVPFNKPAEKADKKPADKKGADKNPADNNPAGKKTEAAKP
ncbi:MAG TPA: tetratricopeptide repeat protein [Patescibacteria group bacterium]|nr:tetratricopeptide repeat protein [Patescibacteria group bacterium]